MSLRAENWTGDMWPEPSRQGRPRTWAELRRRVLEEDHLGVGELEDRRRAARRLKHVIWVWPALLILVAPVAFAEGVSWLMLAAFLLSLLGAFEFYRLGARWERRWDELIREKATADRG
jgi:hypothetical protein